MKPKMTFFILLAALIASLIVSAGSFYLTNQKLSDSASQLNKNEGLAKAADDRLFHLKGLAIKTQKAERELGNIDAIFPEDNLQSEFIDQILKLAEEEKVNIGPEIAFSGGNEVPSPSSQTAPSELIPSLIGMEVTLPISGSHKNVMSFIYSIENFNRLVNIEELVLNSKDQGGNIDGTVTFLILVNQKPATPVAGAKGAKASSGKASSASGSNSAPSSNANGVAQ